MDNIVPISIQGKLSVTRIGDDDDEDEAVHYNNSTPTTEDNECEPVIVSGVSKDVKGVSKGDVVFVNENCFRYAAKIGDTYIVSGYDVVAKASK